MDEMPVEKQIIIKIETPEGTILVSFDTFKDCYKEQPLARLLEDFEDALWNAMFREESNS